MGSFRVIALIDMDCFYVQVEERDDPSIRGKPAAVVQYNAWKGGGIIAVNYEARARGVGRHIRGDEAKSICPEIILVKVPETRGKADLTKYRNAGQEVIKVLTDFSTCVERASIDEAYIDLSEAVKARLGFSDHDGLLKNINKSHLENNFVVGVDSMDAWFESISSDGVPQLDDVHLTIGAEIIGEMRKTIFEKTGFRCSAGIAHNKVLAKLACGINKPNKQTMVPHSSVPELFKTTKLKKVRNLGGKLGDDLVEKLRCETMSDLLRFSMRDLSATLGGKAGSWLFGLARGHDDEPVTARQLAKSIGCNKMFNGPEALVTKEKVKHWLHQLSAEVVERLQKDLAMNNRRAKSLTLSVKFEDQQHLSKSCGTNPPYNAERMAADVFAVLEKLYALHGVQPINNLGLVASKFEDELDINNYTKISTYFSRTSVPPNESSEVVTFNNATVVETEAKLNPQPGCSKNILEPVQSKIATSHPKDGSDHNLEPCVTNSYNSNQSEHNLASFFNRLDSPLKQGSEIREDNNSLGSSCNESVSPQKSSESPIKSFMKNCVKCGQSIVKWDFDSHMDYHFAKDLQREINGLPPLATTTSLMGKQSPKKFSLTQKRPASATNASVSKRGRTLKKKNVNGTSKSTTKGMKTLDTYFSQES